MTPHRRYLDLPTNLVAQHVEVLQDAGLLVQTLSEGARRRTSLRLEPDTLDSLAPPPYATCHGSGEGVAVRVDVGGGVQQRGRLGRLGDRDKGGEALPGGDSLLAASFAGRFEPRLRRGAAEVAGVQGDGGTKRRR
ncbi:hypothetical protein ACFY3L_44445, partial [Dactylosporangium sp. NPDC000521]